MNLYLLTRKWCCVTTVQAERVLAGDIRVGDKVARSRTHPFETVNLVFAGPVAVRLIGAGGRTIGRPRKTAKWWRETA